MKREEAIEIIRKNMPSDKSLPVYEALHSLIPELAESKDERIRKKMIEHFKAKTKETWCNMPVKDIIAYLEKQKECVSNNFDDVWAEEDCEEIIAEGQKLTPRFKELLKEVCHAWYDRGAKLEKQKSGLSFVGDFQAKTLQGPIELAEWKEAAKIREWILAKMQELAATGVPCSDEIKMADKAIDYLIKQKEYIEEPKIAFRDWGDKEKKEAIITCLKYMRFIKKITNQEYDDLIKWLANNTISNVSEKEECLREVEQEEQKPVESISQLTVQGKGVYKICPRCKERMVRDDSMIYTSMPPQYRYECPKCGESECDTVMYDNPEMKEQKPVEKHDLVAQLKEHLANTPKEQLEAEWKELEKWNRVGPTVEEYLGGIKPAEWSEDDEKRIKQLIYDTEFIKAHYEKKKENPGEQFNNALIRDCDEQIAWLKSLLSNLKKKNEDVANLCSKEWSDEDEEMLGKVLECIRFAEDHYQLEKEETNGVSVKLWLLDHIIPQPKQEWSEDDEANRTFILESLEDQIRFCKKDTKGAYYTKQIRIAQNWLKSLSLNLKKKNEDVVKLCSNE